jgi:hypothetical protein
MNRFQEPRGGLQGHWNDARGAPKDREASTPSSCDVPKGTGRSFGPEFQQPANPSFNATANGMPPGPRGCQYYHHPRGPGAMPSSAR